MAGIIRALDSKRRIVLPDNMLKAVDITLGDFVQVDYGQDDEGREALFIKKLQDKCALCGEPLYSGGYMEISERKGRVCIDCATEVRLKTEDSGEEL